jgi:guanylate kinase
MPDDHEERFRRHEETMEGLARLLAAQQEFNRQQQEFNHQQVEINADVKTTLARIEALIARMISTGEHGQEA